MNAALPAWAARIRAERKARGWPAEEMAWQLRDAADRRTRAHLPNVGALVRYVRRWEAGTVGVSERYRMLYACAFGVSDDELFGDEPAPLAGIGDPARLTQAIEEPRRADAKTVAAFEELFEVATRVPETRPRDLIVTMTPIYDLIQRFRRDAPSTVRYGLLSISSRTAQLVSWMYFESGKLGEAVAWSDRALNAAIAAGNEELVGYTLARRSSYAGADGDPAQGVDLAVAAQQRTALSPQVEHMALRHEAQGWALLGDAAACRDRLSRSMDTLARADRDGEPAFASGFSMNYLNVQVAGCYVELGRYLEAIEIYKTGLPAITPGYVRAFNLARLARSYAEVGDRERTAEVGGKALTLARGTGGVRAVTELRRVREDRARWWD